VAARKTKARRRRCSVAETVSERGKKGASEARGSERGWTGGKNWAQPYPHRGRPQRRGVDARAVLAGAAMRASTRTGKRKEEGEMGRSGLAPGTVHLGQCTVAFPLSFLFLLNSSKLHYFEPTKKAVKM
jgi:hypothetical protein